MAVTLYKRQRQIVDFISQYIQTHGYSPTLSEIAVAINVSSLATVHEHLQALIKKKIIRKYEGAVRGIELLDKTIGQIVNVVELPILGYIAAGKPIQPYTDPNAQLKVSPTMLTGKRKAFVLQVKGDSMIEEGIFDSDYVVCEEVEDAKDRDIVVAMLDNKWMISPALALCRWLDQLALWRVERGQATLTTVAVAEERKLVTVLFADVTGSTATRGGNVHATGCVDERDGHGAPPGAMGSVSSTASATALPRSAGSPSSMSKPRTMSPQVKTRTSPSPSRAMLRCASGARSPEAPTEPLPGMQGRMPAL